MVCSGGGHLRQLAGLAERIGYAPDRQVWVTFRNGLSESLLAGRRVVYAPFTAPRDGKNFARLVAMSGSVFRSHDFVEAVSTGSSPAVAFLPQAVLRGIPAHYIESAARADGPSLTGRIIARVPGIRTYSQYPVWAKGRWLYGGSIFDEYTSGDLRQPPRQPRTAVVSVGTQEGYPFLAMLEKVVPLLAGMDHVLYQTGDADVRRLGIDGRRSVPHAELREAVYAADVVITHSGVGAALSALEAGKHPILIPRRAEKNEHIDGHQVQVARELDRRGLATLRFADTLTFGDIVAASNRTVRVTLPPPFTLTRRNDAALQPME
ncbi:glycosyltransferase [Microbacterium caowuchunii]|uniref:glycosyltransferase n=1 Tax=Microbacterium caowuchunii TaxID=2614638 RepID=UPI0017868DA8|nr:glycosyltransferase [Microbacterium caowuchunii]